MAFEHWLVGPDFEYVLAGIATVLLAIYLVFALLRPERF
jgi:K+-transporting ATPase KdpF subunit